MQDRVFIEAKLRETSKRLRLQAAWHAAWKAFLTGALIWVATLVIFKCFPIQAHWLGIVAFLWATLPLATWSFFWLKPIPPMDAARWLDHHARLQERLASALEMDPQSPWSSLVYRDARKGVTPTHLRELMPFQLPRQARMSVWILALGAALGWFPEYRSNAYLEQVAHEQRMETAGKKLVEFVRREIKNPSPLAESAKESLQALEALGDVLSKAQLNRQNALKEVASVRENVEKEMQRWGENPAIKRMQQAARSPSGNLSPSQATQMQQQLQDMEENLGAQEGLKDELETLQKKLQSMAQSLAAAASEQGAMDPSAEQAMRDQLNQLAQQAAEMGLSSQALEAAMQSLATAQPGQMLQGLQQAQMELDQMLAMAQAMENLKMQLEAAGKDLAEQLEKGQAQMARQRLLDMMKKLQSSNLTPAEQSQMLSELREALQPAGDYGEVGKWLQEAMNQLGSDQAWAASQSLEEAAQALESMMQQFQGMASMSASLGMLTTAQMSLGNQMSWGASTSANAGFSKGRLPGGGVGTWGQEGGEWAYRDPGQATTDNSGIQRPEMEGRGTTDRGEGMPQEGLIPTQVRGQIQQGRPMASIPLKGLNIRGQSQVSFTEAVGSAQTEAANALNQDLIPRAYQSTVRDYFDDLE